MSEQDQVKAPFAQWAIVELMGHNAIAGHVSEEVIAGVSFLRIDVPPIVDATTIAEGFTKYFAPSAIYGITPTTEDNARLAAGRMKVRPVTLYILPDPLRPRSRLVRIADPEQQEIDQELSDNHDFEDDEDDDEPGF